MQGISFFAHPHFAQLTLDNDDFGCLHAVVKSFSKFLSRSGAQSIASLPEESIFHPKSQKDGTNSWENVFPQIQPAWKAPRLMCRLRAGSEGGNSLRFLHRRYRLKRAVFSCTNSTELLFSGHRVVVLNN